MDYSTYAKNIQKQVYEIIAQFSDKARENLISTLRDAPKGLIERDIASNHEFLLGYITKTPKSREK